VYENFPRTTVDAPIPPQFLERVLTLLKCLFEDRGMNGVVAMVNGSDLVIQLFIESKRPMLLLLRRVF
jgi:acetolactate synthase regulatory subunit